MAIISGVTVEWTVSPRIITIPAPTTEATIDDLQDTLLYLEDTEEGIVWPHLRNLSGGENLGGGVSVGLTMELQNAQLQFEGRTTPTSSGSATSADTAGKVLVDTLATFQTDGYSRGDTIYNSTTGAISSILSIDSETQLTHQVLSGGSRADWQVSDGWIGYTNALCNVTGGNLVAVDSIGSSIDAIFQSANTNVILQSSSSATSTDLTEVSGLVWAEAIEGTYTAAEVVRIMSASLAGKLSGADTTTITIRDINDTKDRITATVDGNGNRTATTHDVS